MHFYYNVIKLISIQVQVCHDNLVSRVLLKIQEHMHSSLKIKLDQSNRIIGICIYFNYNEINLIFVKAHVSLNSLVIMFFKDVRRYVLLGKI